MDAEQLEMNETTRKVIQHWHRNWDRAVAGDLTEENIDATNCEYCKTFEECKDCPICKKTGYPDCDSTPYYDVVGIGIGRRHEAIKTAVWAELQFLLQIAYEEDN